VFRISPNPGARLRLQAKQADAYALRPVELDMTFASYGGEGPEAYEVLLHAALVGDRTLFARQDSVEETWRVLQPLLDAPPAVQPYPQGSWGPSSSDQVVKSVGGWHDPWLSANGN
jgi:glucose-6-phosphate 1-dehydrogenase